ncbi:MAG: hypothetical protein ACFFD2_28730 [Promethearchaeota archaeon]
MDKSYEAEGHDHIVKTGVDEGELSVLYRSKKVPRRKDYRLKITVCEEEVREFIQILKKKYKEGSVEIIEDQGTRCKVQVDGKSLEEPSFNIEINLKPEGDHNTKVELELDFSPYYKKVFKAGLIGVLIVFAILTVSVGALNLQNLFSLGYLFGSIGLFGTAILVLGVFVWNRTLSFHASALEALYWRLDTRERDVIDQALQQFREKQLIKMPKEKIDTCYHCNTPIPAERAPGEVVCPNCREIFLTCSICLLNINKGEIILTCPHCDSPAHRDHLREWLKIKNYCPHCKQKISEEELTEPD